MRKTSSDMGFWFDLFLGLFAVSFVSAAFWLGWFLHYGDVPRGPGSISRWWDIIIQPIWVVVTFGLIFMYDEYVTIFDFLSANRHLTDRIVNSLAWLSLTSLIVGYVFGIFYGFCLFIPILVAVNIEFVSIVFLSKSKLR